MPTPTPKKGENAIAKRLRSLGLGKQAEAIEEHIEGIGDALNKARVLKKNVRSNRVEKAMLDGLYADIDKLITRHLGAENPTLRDEIVATVLSSAMATSEPEAEADMAEDIADADLDEVMTEEMAMEEDEDVELIEEEKMGKRMYKKEYTDLRKDIGTIATAQNQTNEAFGGLVTEMANIAEAISLLAPVIQELQADNKIIKAKMTSVSKRASQADETRLSSTIAEIVKQASGGDEYVIDPVLKIPVKKESVK